MRKIYIHTSENINTKVLESNILVNSVNALDDIISYEINLTEYTMPFIISLLENIVILKNPIVNNKNIINVVTANVFIPLRPKIEKELTIYFRENNIINLEGYFTFRMENHSMLIHSMLYSIVKKSLKARGVEP